MRNFLRSIFLRLFYDEDQRYAKSFLKGYPFLLYLAPTNSTKNFDLKRNARAVFCRTPGKYDLYLYPDDLKIWFYIFAGIIGLFSVLITPDNGKLLLWLLIAVTGFLLFLRILFRSGQIDQKNITRFYIFLGIIGLFTLIYSGKWELLKPIQWPLIFVTGYIVGFYLVYCIIRLPCLPNMVSLLPHRLEEWFLGHVERINIASDDIDSLKRSRIPADIRLRTMLTKKGKIQQELKTLKRRRYIERLGFDHRQEWLLRIAIYRFFEKPNAHIPSVILRVLFYWGAPVWIGYLLFFIPLFLLWFDKNCISATGLISTLLVWAILSTFFALVQTKLIAPNISSKPLMRKALDNLPIIFQHIFVSKTEMPDHKYFNKIFSKWLIIINFAAFAVFAFLIKFVESSSQINMISPDLLYF